MRPVGSEFLTAIIVCLYVPPLNTSSKSAVYSNNSFQHGRIPHWRLKDTYIISIQAADGMTEDRHLRIQRFDSLGLYLRALQPIILHGQWPGERATPVERHTVEQVCDWSLTGFPARRV